MTSVNRVKATGLVLIAMVLLFAIAHLLGVTTGWRGTLTNVGGAGNACTCSHRIEP